MIEPEYLNLIAAVIERARADLKSRADCEYARGGHKNCDCARELITNLEMFSNVQHVEAHEIADEFMRLTHAG